MQQRLKPTARAAGAQIIAAELFEKLDIAMDEAVAPFDVRFGWE